MAQDKPKMAAVELESEAHTAQIVEAVEHVVAKPKPADPQLAGKYKVTHGSWKVGDRFVGAGSVLSLQAEDAKRGLEAGTIERLA